VPSPTNGCQRPFLPTPRVASVGARSQDLEAGSYIEVVHEYRVADGWAMGDPMGVCKIYVDPVTQRVLGAHVLGERASLLITPLSKPLRTATECPNWPRASTGSIQR
jgi:pyruvate/2-oxoglutarate dehydrogenase complex dihydrolipoamide dehydrogenase (E3) component